MVRTPHSHCQGLGSTPDQGTKTPQAAWHGQRPQRDLPAMLPIGLTLGWSPGGTAMVRHENATGICPNGGSMSHNVQSRTQMLTSTTVRQTATPNLPVREWDHGPPSQLLCKHQRLQHLRPDMANSRGSSGGALGQNRGTQHMGMSKHHQSLGRPLELGLS